MRILLMAQFYRRSSGARSATCAISPTRCQSATIRSQFDNRGRLGEPKKDRKGTSRSGVLVGSRKE